MVSDPLTVGWYVDTQNIIDPMLIVCPNCSTSYTIEPTSLGADRTVRCARCKTTWFADTSNNPPEMTAVGAGTADELEAQGSPGVLRPDQRTAGADSSDAEPAQESAEAVAPAPAARSDPLPAPAGTAATAPVTIADAPSVVPPIEPPSPDAATASEADEIEHFTARRKRLKARRSQARRSSRWTALILVLFAFNVALIGARSEVVRFFPQTASLFSAVGLPVNLRNLKFENMRISKEAQEGLSSLVIEGTIVSIANGLRGATTSVCRARRRRARSLHLDRAAGPQRPWSRRKTGFPQPLCLATGKRNRCDGALCKRTGCDSRSEVRAMARILIAEDDDTVRSFPCARSWRRWSRSDRNRKWHCCP